MQGTRRRVGAVAAALGVAAALAAPGARGAWVETKDLVYGTAHTLDEGELEVGVFSPLQYGVSDRVQVALHPILLLILAPKAALRWRVAPASRLSASIDFEATWSFLDRVRSDGLRVADDSACRGCGFPGSAQITATATWEATDGLLLTLGAGPGLDMLDVRPERWKVASHASVLWLVDAENLLIARAQADLHPWEADRASGVAVQALYARALGFVHVAVGLAFGRFDLVVEEGTVRTVPGSSDAEIIYRGDRRRWPVWPVVDLWVRL